MHAVPVSARISFVYVEKGVLEQDGYSLVLCQGDRLTPIPIGRTSTLLIGPGTSVTHAAVRLCANEGTLLAWVGEHGVRLYPVRRKTSSKRSEDNYLQRVMDRLWIPRGSGG